MLWNRGENVRDTGSVPLAVDWTWTSNLAQNNLETFVQDLPVGITQ